MSTVFLNGEYMPKSEATISPDDRGFLLGDGLYEVTPFYEGVPFGSRATCSGYYAACAGFGSTTTRRSSRRCTES